MARDRAVALVAVLIGVGLFLADLFLQSGMSMPAAFYAVPIVIVAFLLAPSMVAAITVLALILELLGGVFDRIPPWRLAADMLSLVIIGALGVALAVRIRQRMRLAEERARLVEEIDTERARLAAVLAQMPSGVVVAEAPSGKVVLGNEQIEQIWGRPFQPVSSVNDYPAHYPLHHKDGRPFRAEEYPLARSLLMGERVKDEEASFPRGDGSFGTLSISSAPIYDPKGQIAAAVVIFQDVTERKEAERFRDQYIHTVSHDLRAPLTIIMGQAQLLRGTLERARLNGRELRSADAIVTASRRMNLMIQDLVDSARMESRQLLLERQPTDLKAYVTDLLERAKPLLDTRRVRVAMPSDLPPVLADPNRLERILVNLLSNALKYSPVETEVLVTAERVDGEIEIDVTDHGVGIPERDLPRIFDRFYRASGGYGAEGLGLGLYITRMLVEAHHGRIWVESRVGKGSSFHFTLPKAR